MNSTRVKKVLIIAHGHPELNKGGGEIAAYNLFKALDEREDYEALFMGRQSVPGAQHGGTPFSTIAEKEVLFYGEGFDVFKFTQPNKRLLWHNFREFVEQFKPDIVHFHHYLHIGIDAIRVVKNVCPDAKIVLTLHEYLAICHNSGQMIKTNKKLCYQSSPADCHRCFPDQSPQNFFLRELYIKSFFKLVDQFIAPSQFLKDRYVAWGLEENKISVLENGQEPVILERFDKLDNSPKQVRLAYFGQLTQFKGLDVLLDAVDLLPGKVKKRLHLDVHGSGLEIQPIVFQERVTDMLNKLSKHVSYHGPYEPHEMAELIQEVDWVIVPSSWWENSPLVIQEAFKNGKPVICSDIGGMAEKVRNEIDGLHFRVGKATSLSKVLERVAENPVLQARLAANIKKPVSLIESAQEHHLLYQNL
ncbi:MAG: glycosyltransferase family 4 protein [Trueperaceae bacterium]|nr:glycosyltransferase family 4 protein [Trueperaceae bacterium]